MPPQTPASPGGSLGTLLLFGLLIPILAVMIADLVEWVAQPTNWRERLGKLGWDCCVLALGATGGILIQPPVVRGVGDGTTLAAAEIIACFLILVICLVIALVRRGKTGRKMTGARGLVILALGGAALAIPTFLAVKFWR